MSPHRIAVSTVAPQPWRNGGGQTRELLAWPRGAGWLLRISLADISADGPFSSFPGVTRWFAVASGNGVVLDFDGQDRPVRVGDAPLRFHGAEAPGCSLIDGPTRDVNLMVRDGRAEMRPVEPGRAWRTDFRVRALFTVADGAWSAPGLRERLPAHTLLWSDAAQPPDWRFDPESTLKVAGWWLGYTPDGADA